MQGKTKAHQNIGLDEFLVAAGDQASTILDTLPRVPLTDPRFRATARQEQRRRERDDPAGVEAAARTQLAALLSDPPRSAVQRVLDNPEQLEAFAFLKERDRGVVESAMLKLREHGARALDVTALERALRAYSKQRQITLVSPGHMPARPSVRSFLPDAPVPEEAVVPSGWRLSADGVRVEISDPAGEVTESAASSLVAPSPVVISGRLKDIIDESESCILAWKREGRWQSHSAPRIQVASTRHIIELAGVGFPVTSNTAPGVIRYLADFEAANLAALPRARVSKQMGFQGKDGALGFLWGGMLLRADGKQAAAVDIGTLAPSDWREDFIAFHGADAGDAQLAEGFHAAGSFEGWKDTIKLVAPYPRVLLAKYASLTPVLLRIMRASNFCVDWCGYTSTGKTTTLRGAASVWGCPDERAVGSVLGTWDATRVWIERASAVLNNLPLILDDTKRAKQPKAVAQTLYDITSGRGRGRGSPQGMRRAGSWATVGLFSGEATAVSFTEDGGTRGRVLELWGPPFGKADEHTASVVHAFNNGVLTHYGHAGPRFVEYVLRNKNKWDDWQQTYALACTAYLDKAGANPVAGRLAAYVAALEVTAALAHDALELPWEYRDAIDTVWEVLTREASEADRAAHALLHVMSWAMGHQHEFWGRESRDKGRTPRLPITGWAGAWEKDKSWETIAFLPHRLLDLLKDADFESDAILRLWREREWLEVGGDRERYQKKISISGEKPWAYVIKRKAIESIEERQTKEAQA